MRRMAGIAMLWLMAALGPAMGLGGCSSLVPKLQAPQLDIAGVALNGGSLRAQKVAVTFNVTNPNDRQISVSGIDCRIALSGNDFATGQTAAPFVLPALGSSQFTLDLTADLGSVLELLAKQMGAKDVSYRLTGQLHLAEGLIRTVPFTKEGRLPLQ